MEWFTGNIPEAITKAKKVEGIFMVFIYDSSNSSTEARKLLNQESTSQVLSLTHYVCIQLDKDSLEAKQFSEIYPLSIVPSIFFISGVTGIPLEVIKDNFSQEIFENKVKQIQESFEKVASASKISAENSVNLEQAAASVQQSTDISPPEAPSNVASEPISVNTDVPSSAALEERIEAARILLAVQQEQKEAEKIEEDKKQELERRKTGTENVKSKLKREENERREMAKQRKKDKVDDQLARDKVKSQIAADRAERLARENILKGNEEAEVAGPTSTSPPEAVQSSRNSDSTRIKFRFTDNSSIMSQFSSTSTLLDVRNYVGTNWPSGPTPISNFNLVTTCPKRCFTHEENNETLQQLNLVPSAIIFVKPLASRVPSSLVPSGGSVMDIFWSFVAPLTFVFNYISTFLGLGGTTPSVRRGSDSSDDENSIKRTRTEGSYTTRNRPKSAFGPRRRQPGGAAGSRREGNIHRLGNISDDDDENNTWNGNSTQQM